jgi:nucleotide-binding universal stress UspA family protein
LAATDLSPTSLGAVVQAAAEARRRGASLVVVHAIGFLEVETTHLLEPDISILAPGAFDLALDALAAALVKLNVEATCRVLDRPAGAAILREAEGIGAQLVVVGAHGHTALWRWATGRVMEKVLHGAHCSVLIVKPAIHSND